MSIEMTQRFKPFSHQPGVQCLLLGAQHACEIFPALLRIYDLTASTPQLVDEVPFDFRGPVKEFTVCQNLDRGCIDVWGHAKQGYFVYHLVASGEEKLFSLTFDKDPTGCLQRIAEAYAPRQRLPLPCSLYCSSFENLSFGIFKSQEWPMIHRRCSLAEILPFWFLLGQWISPQQKHLTGTAMLLEKIEHSIVCCEKDALRAELEILYRAGFQGILTPRLVDCEHQGFSLPKVTLEHQGSPLYLLYRGYWLIRRMLIDIWETNVQILPCLLPEFHCGKMTNLVLGSWGKLDFEWSKKTIRRMLFQPTINCSLSFCFSKGVSTYRLKEEYDIRGEKMQCGSRVDFSAGKLYYFDNFQHT